MKRPTQKMPGLIATTLLLLSVLLAACGQTGGAGPAGEAATAPAADNDLLAEVKQRGKLLISTDANYKPQSFKNPDGAWEGFDIEVGREIAKRLGVEAEFLDISFDIITAGGWNGRWDINVGSMTVTPERKNVLLFTPAWSLRSSSRSSLWLSLLFWPCSRPWRASLRLRRSTAWPGCISR